jgi:serine/threonine protein phosphatase 1
MIAVETSPGVRIYAIGDIHGRADLLRRLEKLICVDVESAPTGSRCIVVYLGDYIDRGPDSRAVIQHFLKRKLNLSSEVFLKGNHEEVLLSFLDDPEQTGPQWLAIGGIATLFSYGITDVARKAQAGRFKELRDELLATIPSAHLQFFRKLQISWEDGGYLFVHAGIDPRHALDQQTPETMLWIRDAFTSFSGNYGRKVVHGHSIVPRIELLSNRIAVDTGAYATGILSCVVLEGSEIRVLNTA